MRSLRRRLSYANVMASLAMFVALGGVSYAAATLPRGSVGNAQLRRDAVTTSKVKNRSLLAGDFKRGQLPVGARGLQGLRGAQGIPGVRGAQGSGGAAGRGGATGAAGPAGDRGASGLAGGTGATGSLGPTGATGPTGAMGPSDAFSTFKDGPTSIALSGVGCPFNCVPNSPVATLPLQAGKYLVIAKLWVQSQTGGSSFLPQVSCTLAAANDQDNARAALGSIDSPQTASQQSLALTAVHEFTAAGVATLTCSSGLSAADARNIKVTAIRVGNLTNTPSP